MRHKPHNLQLSVLETTITTLSQHIPTTATIGPGMQTHLEPLVLQNLLDSNIALRSLTPVRLLLAHHPSSKYDTKRSISDNLARVVRDDLFVSRLAVRGGDGDHAVGVIGRCGM